jgi:hypothetical protein
MFLSNLNSLVKKTSIIIASKQSYSVRLNEVNVQMINEKYRSLIFGEKKEKNDNDIEKAKKHLQSFELDNKKVEILKEFQDFEMPKFKS